MPKADGLRTADILLKLAFGASAGYLIYDGVTAHFGGNAHNIYLFLYFIIIPNFLVVIRGRDRGRIDTVRGDQALCISLLVFVLVLCLTTLPRYWPVVWTTLFVALPGILSFILLEKNKFSRAQSS